MESLLKGDHESPIARIYRLVRPTKQILLRTITAICKEHRIHCKKLLGEGMYGLVSSPPSACVRPFVDIRVSEDKVIPLPVVVKDSQSAHASVGIIDHGGVLYVWDDNALTNEAFFHSFTNILYQKKKSPHLPLMLGFTICHGRRNLVSRIILERQGKDNIMNYTGTRTNENNFFITNRKNPFLFGDLFSTFGHLKMYAVRTMTRRANGRDFYVVLPRNKKRVLLSHILDTLSISFLITFNMLRRYGFYLRDMHPENLLLHWLGPYSYFHDIPLEDLKEIGYAIVSDRILVIPVFGFLLRINDLGMSVFSPRPDVVMLGQCGKGCRINLDLVPELVDTSRILHHFFTTLLERFPFVEDSVVGCVSFRDEVLSFPYSRGARLDPVGLLDRFQKKYGAKKGWRPDGRRSILVEP